MTASRARSRLAIPALLGLFATTASGCGWFFTHGPPAGHQQMTSFSCTQTFTTTVLDLAGFVWFTVNMEVNARNGNVAATAIDGALTVALTWSGLEGAAKVRNCRAAQAQLASRLAVGGTRAVAQAPPAPPVGPVATRHKRNHIRRAEPRMHARMPAQIDPRDCLANSQERGISDGGRRAREREHRSIVVGIRSGVEQLNLGDSRNRSPDGSDNPGVAPLRKIRH